MEAADGYLSDGDGGGRVVLLATAGVPGVLLCVPAGLLLCPHLQQHVSQGATHLLLL